MRCAEHGSPGESRGSLQTSDLNKLRSISERYEYRVLACAMSDHIDSDPHLSARAPTLWKMLYKLVTFTSDWSVTISNCRLADSLSKSIWTVRRLLNQLERAGYIIREMRAGQISRIYVRFPADAIAKIERENKPRRPAVVAQTPGKTARGSGVHSYYLYNTNNNSQTQEQPPAPPPGDFVVALPTAPEQPSVEAKKNTETQDRAEDDLKIDNLTRKIQKIDSELAELKKVPRPAAYTERLDGENAIAWMRRIEKNKTEVQRDAEEKEKYLERIRGQLDNEIIGIQNRYRVPKTEKNEDYKWARTLSQKLIERIKISTNQRVGEEIVRCLRYGNLPAGADGRPRSVEHSANIFLSVARKGAWTTPRFMIGGALNG